jgi:hypothetical protein
MPGTCRPFPGKLMSVATPLVMEAVSGNTLIDMLD